MSEMEPLFDAIDDNDIDLFKQLLPSIKDINAKL
jgi:hypothetical protein